MTEDELRAIADDVCRIEGRKLGPTLINDEVLAPEANYNFTIPIWFLNLSPSAARYGLHKALRLDGYWLHVGFLTSQLTLAGVALLTMMVVIILGIDGSARMLIILAAVGIAGTIGFIRLNRDLREAIRYAMSRVPDIEAAKEYEVEAMRKTYEYKYWGLGQRERHQRKLLARIEAVSKGLEAQAADSVAPIG